ncbi:MAG: hypothetical protein CMC37_02070 [Flavobacteriaceae bacterium]|nr:hypothetical protein [Flavobacteriaceae bacterium]|tara:strand:+ start:1071 stop:1586 length:516 start_codon:yes stop_codon:yes gene_type:complete
MYRLILIVSIIFLTGCEKDDICPESTQTTPRLVITFYDIDNTQERKNVESLAVYAVRDNELVLIEDISGITTDSIAIPLRNDIGVSNFKFIKNYSVENDVMFGDSNHIYIDYEINDVFISRACGFIANYSITTLLNYDLMADPPITGWITGYEIINSTVTNENQSHVKILH